MYSYCGLDCQKCEAYIATKNNDNVQREKIAKKWSDTYKADIKPEHINCTGCKSDGQKFYYTENLCKVRQCASSKNIENCAGCKQFACEDLKFIFKYAPDAEEYLNSQRNQV